MKLSIVLAMLISCASRPILEVKPSGCIPTPDGTLYTATPSHVVESCKGADNVAGQQALGNMPDCIGTWFPSPDRCTYDVYSECHFDEYELGATVRITTILEWNFDWSHGIASQTYDVLSVGHSRLCTGKQNIDLVRE